MEGHESLHGGTLKFLFFFEEAVVCFSISALLQAAASLFSALDVALIIRA